MKIPLSPRLQACSRYVHPGDRVADVGCDHGYLGIHLLIEGTASRVIASDVNEGPLQSAVRNAEKYGVRSRMSFHLSDGVQNIPRDFDCMVCAGMGADTMISILEAAPWLHSKQYRLILQCQSKTHMLRQYLSEQGWHIARETVLRDGRFLYTVMEVLWEPGHLLTPAQCYFSPALLEDPAPELPEYYRRVVGGLQLAVDNRGADSAADLAAVLQELQQTPALQFLKGETP